VSTLNVVNLLGIMPHEVESLLLKKTGDRIEKGEVIAESKSFIKWLRSKITSPITGYVESVSLVTGQVLLRELPLPVEVKGYIDGQVVEEIPHEGIVVETAATFIQGIFGIGGEAWGRLTFAVNAPDETLTPDKLTTDLNGTVVVAGSFAGYDAIKKAQETGVRGLIVGGIDDEELTHILGYDLGVAITGTEDIGIVIILTEGFGKIPMAERTFRALKEREGCVASICGATQIRAGVIRPEIIVPYDNGTMDFSSDELPERQSIKIGDQIRIIRHPYFGRIGVVHSLPSELCQIETETKARVLEVAFPDGSSTLVPRANTELIEG